MIFRSVKRRYIRGSSRAPRRDAVLTRCEIATRGHVELETRPFYVTSNDHCAQTHLTSTVRMRHDKQWRGNELFDVSVWIATLLGGCERATVRLGRIESVKECRVTSSTASDRYDVSLYAT